jgi:phosphoribosyl-AMP cyclohydrolase
VLDIHGFVDAVWVGDLDQIISTREYVFNLFGGAINWMNKRQVVVELSTTKAEYMKTIHVVNEKIWLQIFCSGIGLVHQVVRIDCDSQSAIFLVKNLTYHSKKKHIDVQYNFMRDMVKDKKALLMKVDTVGPEIKLKDQRIMSGIRNVYESVFLKCFFCLSYMRKIP